MNAAPSPDSLRFVGTILGPGAGRARYSPLGGGRNSRVFRVDRGSGAKLVLKEYSSDFVARKSLFRESMSFRLLHRHGIRSVPEVVAVDEEHGAALYTDLGGRPCSALDQDDRAFDPFVDFTRRLREIPIEEFPHWARDASCHSLSLIEQIEERLARFPSDRPDLDEFLSRTLRPRFRILRDRALEMLGPEPILLPESSRVLSPSDFGFHNALRREDGSIGFVDFEFFGQDDPVKMLSDMLHHPGMQTRPEQKRHLVDGYLESFGGDPGFGIRLDALHPLVGVKWSCILLNEFVGSDRSRREFASGTDRQDDRILQTQLCKSRNLLDNLWQETVLANPQPKASP